jgi:hypothetical protein
VQDEARRPDQLSSTLRWLWVPGSSALGKGTADAPGALKKSFFKKNKATDKDDFLTYKGGIVFYDADGNGAKYKPVEIIKIANKAALSAADFFII